jgi:hypothetical protein
MLTVISRTTTKKKYIAKETKQSGCWWLTPTILAIQEAEIRRIAV